MARILALAVLLGSLVAVPALTTPASADGSSYRGTLRVGEVLRPTRSFFTTIRVYSDPGCGQLLFESSLPDYSYTVPRGIQDRYVTIGASNGGFRFNRSTCQGPVQPAPDFGGPVKVGGVLQALNGYAIQRVDAFEDASCQDLVELPSVEDGAAYTIPSAAVDRRLVVHTKEIDTGLERTSGCLGPVAPGTFDGFDDATYGGAPAVGTTLTANEPTVPSGTTVSYSWTVSTEGGTREVSSGRSYTPDVAELGEQLTLAVTATRAGYETRTRSSAPVRVQGRPFAEDVFDGVALADSTPDTPLRPGDVLTTTSSTAEVPADTSFSTRFGRSGQDGQGCDASGQAQESYTVDVTDAGSALCAVVTVSAPGHEDTSTTLRSEVVSGVFTDGSAGLSGEPTVDETVSVALRDVEPSDHATAYEWTIDGSTVSETPSFQPSAQDVGKVLTVEVTASRFGYASRSYVTSATIVPGEFSGSTVSVVGAAKVGETLTASLDDELPIGSTVSFRWGAQLAGTERCESVGVTSRTLTLPKSARGTRICVTADIDVPGYRTAARTSETTDVVTGLDPQVWLPTIDDTTPTFGQTLTASVDPRDLPKDASVGYRWGHRGEKGCELLEGAEGATYEVGLDDLGHRLCVTSTASAFGYEDGSATSRPTAEVQKASMGRVLASLSDDTPTVGDTITASYAGAGVPAGAAATYVFTSVDPDSSPVECPRRSCDTFARTSLVGSGADREVTAADLGHRLRATVTVTAPGYEDAVAATDYSLPVAKASFEGGSVSLGAQPTVDAKVTPTITAPTQAPDTTTTVWTVGDQAVEAAEDGSFTPRPADAGKTLTATVTFSRDGFEDRTVTASATVTKGTLSGGSVALSAATAQVGRSIEASTPTKPSGTSDPAVLVWTVGGVKVAERVASYRPRATDAGKTLQVTATWATPGYADVVRSASIVKIAAAPRKVTVDKESVRRGESFTVAATGLKAGQLVDVRLAGRKIGIGRADVYGSFSREVMFPTATKPATGLQVQVNGFVRSKNRWVLEYRASTSITLTR